jgi:hypothetical protein
MKIDKEKMVHHFTNPPYTSFSIYPTSLQLRFPFCSFYITSPFIYFGYVISFTPDKFLKVLPQLEKEVMKNENGNL